MVAPTTLFLLKLYIFRIRSMPLCVRLPPRVAERRHGVKKHACGMFFPWRDRAAARQLSAELTDEGLLMIILLFPLIRHSPTAHDTFPRGGRLSEANKVQSAE